MAIFSLIFYLLWKQIHDPILYFEDKNFIIYEYSVDKEEWNLLKRNNGIVICK